MNKNNFTKRTDKDFKTHIKQQLLEHENNQKKESNAVTPLADHDWVKKIVLD